MVTPNTIASPEPLQVKALLLAVGLHLLILLPALIAPYLFFLPQKAPQKIHTVNLFTVAELASPPLAPPIPAQTPALRPTSSPHESVSPQEPPTPSETIVAKLPAPPPTLLPQPTPTPVEPEPRATPAAPTPAPVQPVTIAPRTPVKAAPTPPPLPVTTRPLRGDDDVRRLAQLRQSLLLKAQAQEAAHRAKDAQRQAVAAVQDAIWAQTPVVRPELTSVVTGAASATATMAETTSEPRSDAGVEKTGGPRGDAGVEKATREYLISLHRHVQNHWTLPDLATWDPNLVATVVITIRRDGSIRKSTLENRTENVFFNQFVQTAIRKATPMPPFPEALPQSEMEIGLRFRPGEVF